ncbi:MAG: glycoside hydrolase, partial [Kocuria sp.]|nr:glycoside hydrolase [Kocuria sp.]
STVFEPEKGELVLLMRNQNSRARVDRSRSSDGGQTWGPVDFDPQLTEIFSQPNAVALSTERGRGVVFANASQLLPFRSCGVLRLSYDDGRTWPHNKVFNPRHYVYQSMAQLSDGSIGLLWEREWHGIYFTRIPLSWLEESRQSLTSL